MKDVSQQLEVKTRVLDPCVDSPVRQWLLHWARKLVGWASVCSSIKIKLCSNEASKKLPRRNGHFLFCNLTGFYFRKDWEGSWHLSPGSIVLIQYLPAHHIPEVKQLQLQNKAVWLLSLLSFPLSHAFSPLLYMHGISHLIFHSAISILEKELQEDS